MSYYVLVVAMFLTASLGTVLFVAHAVYIEARDRGRRCVPRR